MGKANQEPRVTHSSSSTLTNQSTVTQQLNTASRVGCRAQQQSQARQIVNQVQYILRKSSQEQNTGLDWSPEIGLERRL